LNFVLDVGNVLVEYKPLEYLKSLFSDASVVDKLHNSIFKSREWVLMDLGVLTHNEAVDIFYERAPELKLEICYAMNNLNTMFIPVTNTVKLLPVIKEAGHGLYYLSNIHKEIRDFLLENHSYYSLFDGGVFSCDINAVKPSPEIYRHLIDKYRLAPGDCVFFDDFEENVAAAEKEGIKSVLFTTADCVLEFL